MAHNRLDRHHRHHDHYRHDRHHRHHHDHHRHDDSSPSRRPGGHDVFWLLGPERLLLRSLNGRQPRAEESFSKTEEKNYAKFPRKALHKLVTHPTTLTSQNSGREVILLLQMIPMLILATLSY